VQSLRKVRVVHLKLAAVLALSCPAVFFIAQNTGVVSISFLVWQASLSIALLIFFSLLLGLLLGWFGHGYFLHRAQQKTPA